MNCTECKELMTAYVEGLLAGSEKQLMESHLADCLPCRAELAELTALRGRLTANASAFGQSNLEDKVLNRIIREQSLKLKQADRINRQLQLWRTIMKSRISKFAAAAVIIIAVVLSINIFDKSVAPAYAIEQTIQASHTVRYLHIKGFNPLQDEPTESWVEFDRRGQVKSVRMDLPEWAGGGDGAKAIVWKENKAQIWLKKKKSLLTIKDKSIADQFLSMAKNADPKLAVERLQEAQGRGEVEVKIEEPSNKTEPIVVTATSIREDDDSPFQRMVLFVDQATRLVNSVELYQLIDGEYNKVMTLEYYDYNQPIDAKMFTLDEVPDDVMRIDETTQEIGLEQGDLTDKEIAVKVVREFYEALIAKDYAKAGQLYSGIPAGRVEEMFGDFNVVRIISISEPEPHPIPGVGGFRVPCKIEIEKDGVKSVYEGPGVRPVHSQPDRWSIHGGVN